jgi:uncharacterized protein YegP (UPF0339 family)
MSAPVIYVDIYSSDNKRTKTDRPQRWRWRAINADNNRKMATSGEAYSNYQDCFDAIVELFGDGTNVYLREAEKDNAPLRMASA